eukprot:gene20368-50888_t
MRQHAGGPPRSRSLLLQIQPPHSPCTPHPGRRSKRPRRRARPTRGWSR